MATLDSTGAASKARIKEGDQLIPKTTFKPIAAPGKLHGLKVKSIDDLIVDGHRSRLIYDDLLRIFVASKTPITLWGPMGSGKTRSVEAFGEETDENGTPYRVMTVQPSTEDPTIMHGMMTIIKDPTTGRIIMERSIPQIAEDIFRYFNDKDGLTILFLDEMTTCIPAQQNAMLGLLTHGRYGNMDISRYVSFVMAANPPGTVEMVNPLSEAVINRGGHIPWFSEKDHFLNKWKRGFGNPALVPDKKTATFIEGLINDNPEVAFRDDPDHHDSADEGWTIDDLCPYNQMHFSERAATEVAKVYNVIQSTFSESPYDVRRLYIEEAIKAMVGPRWADSAGIIEDAIESSVGTEPSVDAINKYDIDTSMSPDEVFALVGDRLHRRQGKKMRSEQEKELATIFEQEIFGDNGLSRKKYIAFWLWLSTSNEQSTRTPVLPIALNILLKVDREHKEEMARVDVLPKFVPKQIKDELRELAEVSNV